MDRTLTQMYLLLTSISGVFMGMNSVLFFFCVYVLWGQKSKSRRLLLFSSILQFCLCLVQVILFIAYLSFAFTVYADAAESYFLRLSDYALPCYIIYVLNTAIEGLLLTWRMYILYNNNIKICIPLIILLALQVGFGGATAKGFATAHVNMNYVHVFDLVTWALIVAVNVSATTLIFLRLWTARQKAITVLNQSKYKSTIIIVVECGALVTICMVAILILRAVKHPVGLSGLGIGTQVATMAPLLIIARHGILSRRDDRCQLPPQIPLHINVVRTEDTCVDTPVEFTRKNRLVSDPPPVSPSGSHPKPFCDA